MIRMKEVMAIARAERLITRRLVRYWIFLGLAFLITLIIYLRFTILHGLYSSYGGTFGGVTPRFFLSAIGGLYYTTIFLVGTIFLSFDVRARDNRERMSEVLDPRPYSNLELVTGRFLGIFLCSWIPIVVLAILFELLGLILTGLDLPVGELIEIFSIFSFIFMMAIPALAFAIALAFFITLLVRNRLVSAVILLALIGLSYWSTFNLPLVYGSLFDIIGISGISGIFSTSEIIPRIASPEGWIQRFSVLFTAVSLLGLSASVHPRLDGGSRLKLTAGSITVMIFALFLSGVLFFKNTDDIRLMETWKEAHGVFTHEIVPDLKKITGRIKVSPGKDLSLDLDIIFSAPDDGSLQKALFTLNPGQKVKSVSDSTGKSMTFSHEDGLLEFSLPQILVPGKETTVHLTIQGLPDNRFAFLETAIRLETLRLTQMNILTQGEAPGVFDKDFIALMPGLRWLPVSGSEKGRDDPRIRSVDYFNVDLKVDLPQEWLVAGPGKRHKVEGNNSGASFRFSPPAPVPEVALIAARFESRAMEVEGVTLEALINKKHMKNFEVLAETEGKIREWIGDRFREAKEYGLGYPYDALTLVEVPNILRSYGGGWRLDTAMAPPGMLLMREMGFPTTRFDSAFRKPEDFKDKEGGMAQAKWERLKTFFTNDVSGGNVLSGGARNFFLYQTSAKGPEGLALNYVMEVLANLLITETRSYSSTHLFLAMGRLGRLEAMTNRSYRRDPTKEPSFVDAAMDIVISRPEVWDQALGVSLKDMDPWEDPARTVDVLTLKADAIARSILDTLGHEKTRQLLASLRQSHKGRSFSFNDMVGAGKVLGHNLSEILGDWLSSTDLPGFVCEKAKIYRIPDSEDGNPRYQMLFKIRNDEPTPGLFRFVYYYRDEGVRPGRVLRDPRSQRMFFSDEGRRGKRIESAPIHLAGKSAIQFGTVVFRPPASVFLEPYLSLNRKSFSLLPNRPDEEKIEKKEAIEGLKELPYAIPQEASIVVDDLDSGFTVTETEKVEELRINARKNMNRTTDQGLPVAPSDHVPAIWSRKSDTTSWGKYRHTAALIKAGKGEQKAVFTAAIPHAGPWDLELHLPYKPSTYPGRKWGTWNLVIKDNNGDPHEIQFDSNAAVLGWNLAYSLGLPEGEISVILSDKTDGQLVVADAIRWSPSAGK